MSNNSSTFKDLTDAALIRLVQDRNEAAFTELIFRYTPRIWTLIVRNSRQRQDAEEIRNDVWIVGCGYRRTPKNTHWTRKRSAFSRLFTGRDNTYKWKLGQYHPYLGCGHWSALANYYREHYRTGASQGVRAISLSPDGQTVASTTDEKVIRLWDVHTGKLTGSLVGHSHEIAAVAFSPSGTVLASGGDDATLRLWMWKPANC